MASTRLEITERLRILQSQRAQKAVECDEVSVRAAIRARRDKITILQAEIQQIEERMRFAPEAIARLDANIAKAQAELLAYDNRIAIEKLEKLAKALIGATNEAK